MTSKTTKSDIKQAVLEWRILYRRHWQSPTSESADKLKKAKAKVDMLKEAYKYGQ